jgi:alpha-tubulin suppressor-like RCC1 family protein
LVRTLSLIAIVGILPACGEVLGADFDGVGEDCSIEGERRCGDGLVCTSGKWAPDTAERFCAGGHVVSCAGESAHLIEACKGPCADGACRSVEELEVGVETTCARLDDGSVWCWGDNGLGALGRDPTIDWSGTPAPVSGVSGAIDLALGHRFGCALTSAGSVACWGDGSRGGIGAKGGSWSASAVKIEPLGEVEALFAARETACARAQDGSFSCWGVAEYPCMPEASDGWAAFFPVPLPELDGASSMFAADRFLCGLKQPDGQLACCHDGHSAWLSAGLEAEGLVAGAGGKDHVCIGSASGDVSCWGSNHSGQLCARPRLATEELTSISVGPLAKMAAGFANTYFLDPNGKLTCCGSNSNSECGRPSTLGDLHWIPVEVMSNVLSIGSGDRHACALTLEHEVLCWGVNLRGQCGTNEPNLVAAPTPVVWQP